MFIENYHIEIYQLPHWNLSSCTILKITGVNSFFIDIMTLLIYLNPFQSFILGYTHRETTIFALPRYGTDTGEL